MLSIGLQMAKAVYQGIVHKILIEVNKCTVKQLLPKRSLGHSWPYITNCRNFKVSPLPFLSPPRDYSLPNPSWNAEMQRLYDHYNSLCETGVEGGAWTRLPSYNRILKYAMGGKCLSKMLQAKARLFTRNIEEPGAAFEYTVFMNQREQTCVCVFQAGHLLEGPLGHVHGGAIATIIDSVTGTHVTYTSGLVMTANLNINYRSPIPLGSTVLIYSTLDSVDGRKISISCKVTSSDGSKVHTEATALFLSINASQLFGA